jgi:ribosomal-protein-alanine N-acetyltransferase
MTPIILKPLARGDAADLINANVVNAEYHAPWLQPLVDQARFNAWFAAHMTAANVTLIARHARSGGIVGVVSFTEIVLGVFRSAYLGYYGMADYAGSGLMTESVRAATKYAFDEIGLHRVEAAIQPGNLRSIALVRRLGFQNEGFSPKYLFINGEWRDCERWALLAENWRPAGNVAGAS